MILFGQQAGGLAVIGLPLPAAFGLPLRQVLGLHQRSLQRQLRVLPRQLLGVPGNGVVDVLGVGPRTKRLPPLLSSNKERNGLLQKLFCVDLGGRGGGGFAVVGIESRVAVVGIESRVDGIEDRFEVGLGIR